MDQESLSHFNTIQHIHVTLLVALFAGVFWRPLLRPAIHNFLLTIDPDDQHRLSRRLLTSSLSLLLSILLFLSLHDLLHRSLTRPIELSNDTKILEKSQVQHSTTAPSLWHTLLDSVNVWPSESTRNYYSISSESPFDDPATSLEQRSSWPSNHELPDLEGYKLALLSIPQEERTPHWWQAYYSLSMYPPLLDQWESERAANEPELEIQPAPPSTETPSLVSEWKANFVTGVKHRIYYPVRLFYRLGDGLSNLVFPEPPWITNRNWMLKQPRFNGMIKPHSLNPLLRVNPYVRIRMKHPIFLDQEQDKISRPSVPSVYVVGGAYDEQEMERVYREMLAGPSSAGPSYISMWTHDQWQSWKKASEFEFDFFNQTHYPFTEFVMGQMKRALI